MSTIFDLDAFIAEAQDTAEPFLFRFDGEEYALPPYPDLAVIGKMNSGDLIGMMADLLGPEQYARFEKRTKAFDPRCAKALLDRYGETLGVGEQAGG